MSPYFYYTILVFTEVMLIGGGVPEPGAELGGGGGGAGGGPALYPGVGGRPSATGLSSQAGKYNPRLVPLITVMFRRPGLRAPPPPPTPLTSYVGPVLRTRSVFDRLRYGT